MIRGHSRFLSVELPVVFGFTGGKVDFTDTQTTMMRSDGDKDVAIYSITSYHSGSLPLTVNGNPVATEAQLENAFLTLYILGNEQLKDLSMRRFLNQQNAAGGDYNAREYFATAPLRVDWTNSFIQFATPGTEDTAAYSFVFEFEYEWLPPGSIKQYLQNTNNKWASGLLM
jgi:hypothetical protein